MHQYQKNTFASSIRKRTVTIQDQLPPIHSRSPSLTFKSPQIKKTIYQSIDSKAPPLRKKVTFVFNSERVLVHDFEHNTVTDTDYESQHVHDQLLRRQNQVLSFLKQPKLDQIQLLYTFHNLEFSDEIKHSITIELLSFIIIYLFKNDSFPDIHQGERIRFCKSVLMHQYLWMHEVLQNNEDFKKRLEGFLVQNHQFRTSTLSAMRQLLTYVCESVIYKNITNESIKKVLSTYLSHQWQHVEDANKFIKGRVLPALKNITNNSMQYYLPQADIYTLVLDLDETLIFYDYEQDILYQRPHLQTFLRQMFHLYEIVVFTGGLESYANEVINQIDPYKYIKFRLYRQHTIPKLNFFIKDLHKLGRPLSKTIIVDNTPSNFSLQPENGITIKSWNGDMDDTELLQLCKTLKKIKMAGVDVRTIISK